MFVIGLTGPSGAGKGTVCSIFGQFGIPSIDTDAVYRELLAPPSACLNDLVQTFGERILSPDGTLNRRALGAIVFSDKDALGRLDQTAHRHIMAEVRRRLAALRERGVPAVVIDAPQLFEADAARDCNAVVSVLAEESVRLERIMRRDRISEADARRRMRAQYPDAFFRTHSDYVLENNTNPEALIPSVRKLLGELGISAATAEPHLTVKKNMEP